MDGVKSTCFCEVELIFWSISMRPIQSLAVLAILLIGVTQCHAQSDVKDKKDPKADSLEQMQAEALKNSHDIKVHEAQVRLVQAELDRSRAILKTQIAITHAHAEAAQAGCEVGKAHYDRAARLFQLKAISFEDLDVAKLTWEKKQKEKVVIDSRLRCLVGQAALGKSEPPEKLMEKALRSNPDVKVAAARLILTQTELERTRVNLAMQVEIAVAKVEEARAAFADAENRFKRAKQIDISREDFDHARLTMRKCRSESIAAELNLRLLLSGGSSDQELIQGKRRD